jgi:hypothetical protein
MADIYFAIAALGFVFVTLAVDMVLHAPGERAARAKARIRHTRSHRYKYTGK